MTKLKIVTRYDPPPIPVRRFDWTAVRDDYEAGYRIGYGHTEAEAINDLLELEKDHLEPKISEPTEADAQRAWRDYCAAHDLPPDIPENHDEIYPEWKGWRDFLGWIKTGAS